MSLKHTEPSPYTHPNGPQTEYITSGSNPADGPSRGKLGPERLLLPETHISPQLKDLIVDATLPLTPTEFRLFRNGQYSPPAAKLINSTLIRQQAIERARAARAEEDQIIINAIAD